MQRERVTSFLSQCHIQPSRIAAFLAPLRVESLWRYCREDIWLMFVREQLSSWRSNPESNDGTSWIECIGFDNDGSDVQAFRPVVKENKQQFTDLDLLEIYFKRIFSPGYHPVPGSPGAQALQIIGENGFGRNGILPSSYGHQVTYSFFLDHHPEAPVVNLLIPEPPTRCFYHGTTLVSALHILYGDENQKSGIDLLRGKRRQDFSHKNGFSLTSSLEEAKSWAMNQPFVMEDGSAILIYSLMDSVDKDVLDCSQEKELWQDIIQFHRRGKINWNWVSSTPFDQKIRGKSIKGPLAELGSLNPNDIPLNYRFEQRTVDQFCVRTDDHVDLFNQSRKSLLILSVGNEMSRFGVGNSKAERNE
jgi:hypothetical protein